MAGAVRIRLSSAVAVDLDGRTLAGRDLGSRKARTLLAVLAAERGRLVPLDRIAEVLWGPDPPGDPAANVSTLVSRSRRLLGAAVLSASGRAYGLGDRAAWTVDLDDAAALVGEAEARSSAGETGLAAAGSRTALELLGDQPALLDEQDADWVLAVRREADTLRRRARHVLTASLTPSAPVEAAAVAVDAVRADPFDERAVRDLMRALVATGRPAAALEAYDGLARRLRRELGSAPASATAELHLAVLRESEVPVEHHPRRPAPSKPSLVGRETELAEIEHAWGRAGGGRPGLVLVEGEGGIGKTRLLDAAAGLAEHTGGLVLRGRCHPTERSLFLEPFVEALRPVLLEQREGVLAELVRDHEATWVGLLPELAPVLPGTTAAEGLPELRRRRAYDGVAAVLRRLSRRRPVLLTVDDVQDGSAATIDLLGYLAAQQGGTGVLVVAAVRSEDEATLARLRDRATVVHLDVLSRSAVDALAGAAGLPDRGAAVMERTGGHPLSVVESLRALAAGESGVPATLREAVLARVGRLPAAARDVLLAATVLRRRLEPLVLADLTETTELAAVRECETLARARLLVRSGRHYEFANDLLQECLHAELAPALATAYHRRAADLSTSRPEVMAEHAFAAGDGERAAHGWLLAGEAATRRAAVDDAAALYARGLEAASDPLLRARLLLARAATHEARTSYAQALTDIDEALALAHHSGDRRLQMTALRARGGDTPIGLHLPTAEASTRLDTALAIAGDLGDRAAEADISARLTVLDVSRLRFTTALRRAETTLRRVGGHPEVRVLALDALKTPLAYLGDADRLQQVVAELEPQLRAGQLSWLLQWAIFESAFVPAAHGRWQECRARVAEATEINRSTGYTAYAGFFEAHQGWFDRLAGDLDAALAHGRRAVELTSPADHPWWYAAACGQLAATLIEAGDHAGAASVARRGLAATDAGTAEAWRLRCAAPLAVVSDDDADWDRALALLRRIDTPPGRAWVAGADCYLLVGRAALRRSRLDDVAAPLLALREATSTCWAPVRRGVDLLLAQNVSASS